MERRTSSYSNLNRKSPAQVMKHKSLNQLTKLAVCAAITAMTLMLAPPYVSAQAQTQSTSFVLAGNSTSVSLVVPARTSVQVNGVLNPFVGPPIPVVFELVRPGDTSPSAGLAVVPSNSGQTFFTLGGEANPTTFTSQVGCPSVWRLRIRMGNNQPPPGSPRTGTVNFNFERPDTVRLEMLGPPINIPAGQSRTVFLSGQGQLGIANNSLIAGTGRLRIRAKWLAAFPMHQLLVELRRPNGSLATSQTGTSQLNQGNGREIDFGYTVTPADAAMNGLWRLRIRNTVTFPLLGIGGFDIESSVGQTFNSTFQARCN
jgi:hypothetical protein